MATVVQPRRETGSGPSIRERFGQRGRGVPGGAKSVSAEGGVQRQHLQADRFRFLDAPEFGERCRQQAAG